MKFCIIGASGRMGQALIRSCYRNDEHEVSAAIVRKDSKFIGKDIGDISEIKTIGVAFSSDIESGIKNCDVVIDFTTPGNTKYHLDICEKYSKKIVIGTTGLGENDNNLIKEYASKIGIVYASNYSLGVNLMFKLCQMAGKVLSENGFDDIVVHDIHHIHKIDSPSGTAISIGNAINNSISSENKISYDVKREGEVVGYHNAVFSSDLEEFGIYHNAKNRDVFANGAIVAGVWLAKCENFSNVFDMTDVLNLK